MGKVTDCWDSDSLQPPANANCTRTFPDNLQGETSKLRAKLNVQIPDIPVGHTGWCFCSHLCAFVCFISILKGIVMSFMSDVTSFTESCSKPFLDADERCK